MSKAKEKPFFVGYLPVPGKLRSFLVAVSTVLIVGFFAAGWVVGATQDDPGPGAFRFDFGRQTVTGILALEPYPIAPCHRRHRARRSPGAC